MSLTISDLEFEKTLLIDEETLFEIQYYDKLQSEITAPFKIGMEGILSAIWKFISSIFGKIRDFFSSLFGSGSKTIKSAEAEVKQETAELTKSLNKLNKLIEQIKKEQSKVYKKVFKDEKQTTKAFFDESIKTVFKEKTIISPESLIFLVKSVNIYIGTGKLMIEHVTPVAEKIANWMSLLNESKKKFVDEFNQKYLNNKALTFDKSKMAYDTSCPLGKLLQTDFVDKITAQFKSNAQIFFTSGEKNANLSHLVNGKLANLKNCPSVRFITKEKYSVLSEDLLKILYEDTGMFSEFQKLVASSKYEESMTAAKGMLKYIDQCRQFSNDFLADENLKGLKRHANVINSLKTMIESYAVISTAVYRTCFITPLLIMKIAAKQLKSFTSVVNNVTKETTNAIKKSGGNVNGISDEKSEDDKKQNELPEGDEKNELPEGDKKNELPPGKNKNNEKGQEDFHGEFLDGNLLGNVPLFSVNQGGLERLHQLDDVNYQENIYTPVCAVSDVLTIENDLKQLKLSFLTPGCEGLISLILRFFTKLADTIGSLLNNFRMVYRAFRGLKRAEIHTFQEKNFATIRRVKSQSFFDLAMLPMPKPKGLTSTYLDATNALTLCLNACDMVNRSKSFVEISENILERVEIGATVAPIIGALNGTSSEVTQITNLYGEVTKCFTNNHMGTAPFKSLFRSMDEFSQVHDELDKSCSNEYDVTPVFKNLEKCSSNFEQILNTLKKQKDADVVLNKDEIVSMSDACLFMAKTFDTYGLSLQDLNRVEHNYVEVIKEITRVKKL